MRIAFAATMTLAGLMLVLASGGVTLMSAVGYLPHGPGLISLFVVFPALAGLGLLRGAWAVTQLNRIERAEGYAASNQIGKVIRW